VELDIHVRWGKLQQSDWNSKWAIMWIKTKRECPSILVIWTKLFGASIKVFYYLFCWMWGWGNKNKTKQKLTFILRECTGSFFYHWADFLVLWLITISLSTIFVCDLPSHKHVAARDLLLLESIMYAWHINCDIMLKLMVFCTNIKDLFCHMNNKWFWCESLAIQTMYFCSVVRMFCEYDWHVQK
jgi:hypothetical protein